MSRNVRDFHLLKRELLDESKLFVDREFPPDAKSLTFNGRAPRGLPFRGVEWKRPHHIVKHPKFVSGALSRSDLDQGMLGIIRFNFWWYGRWTEVIIDDYLPTDGTNLIYCSNWEEKDEFWGALLEKAYAKLRGCYEALSGGKLQDALVDMTGGLGEMINIADKSEIPDNLYDLMWKCSQMNSMLGASIHLPEGATRPEVRRNNGLYMGHAYSITALSVVPFHGSSVKLLRIRNPWGRKEWIGPWSDKSPEITNLPMDVKRKLNIVIEEEGEFWMSYQDFIANFDEVQFCHLQPDAVAQDLAKATGKQNWSVTVYHDAWIRGVTAGGCGNSPYRELYWKNPQFQLRLKDVDVTDNKSKCTLIISLMEKEIDNRSRIAVGFDIYQVRNPQNRPMDGENLHKRELIRREQSGMYSPYREVVRRFELPPGYYVVIPSTFRPDEEAEFILRLYTEKEVDSEVMDENNSPSSPVVPPKDTVSSLFQQYAGEDGKMDYKELRLFLQAATEKELEQAILFNEESCRSLLTMMDLNRSGFVELDQAESLFNQLKTYSEDRSGYINLEEAKSIFREVRAYSFNNSGFIDINEAKELIEELEDMVAVFRQFDKDRSNSVDTIELGTMFNKLGFPVSRMVLTSIVRRYGSRDRKINLVDFIIVISKLIVMFNVFKAQQQKTGGPEDVAQFTRNEVFMKERERDDNFLSLEDIYEVLDEKHSSGDKLREGIVGYPSHPLYKQIACMLQVWMDTKHCPILDLPKYDLLDEKVYVESRAAIIAAITPLLEGLRTLYTLWVEEEIIFRLRDILVTPQKLDKRGILDLLGVRKTVGTKDLWPTPRKLLEACFCALHSSKAELTVGARALAKHHHRDQSDSWWGTSAGTEKAKNEHALKVMNTILDNATWINIHWLPHDLFVIEARVAEGYGARWTSDASQFRGFLEPQMVDGHEVGWRH